MSAVETIADLLLEIMQRCMEDFSECSWLEKWTDLTTKFAFQFNPSLQSRSIVTLGCICKTTDDKLLQQVLHVLVLALSQSTDTVLIEAAVMCLTRLQVNLTKESKFHVALFWISVAVLQLSDVSLYPCGLALLEQSLISLESHKILESQPIEEVLMTLRKDPHLQFHCKQMDHFVGLNFYNSFHFALVAHLVKGVYHPHATTAARAIRILNLMLNITSKFKHGQDKFAVCEENIAYLAALLPVSKEIRERLRLDAPATPSSRSSSSSSSSKAALNRSESTLSVDSQVSIVVTPPNSSPSGEEEPFVWPTRSQFLLLDPGVVSTPQLQALLLTVLVTLLEHTSGDAEVRFLYEVLAQASIVFSKIFPVIYSQLDGSLSKVLGHSHDVPTLEAVETIIQSMSAAQTNDQAAKANYLAAFGFSGLGQFTKFKDNDGQNNRAQLLMKFLETILDVYGHPDVESAAAILQSALASSKPLNLSSSSGDLRMSGVSSLSSSLVSIPGVIGNTGTFIPMPFKRSGSSYRLRKNSKDQTKAKRHLSVKGLRKGSLKGGKF